MLLLCLHAVKELQLEAEISHMVKAPLANVFNLADRACQLYAEPLSTLTLPFENLHVSIARRIPIHSAGFVWDNLCNSFSIYGREGSSSRQPRCA